MTTSKTSLCAFSCVVKVSLIKISAVDFPFQALREMHSTGRLSTEWVNIFRLRSDRSWPRKRPIASPFQATARGGRCNPYTQTCRGEAARSPSRTSSITFQFCWMTSRVSRMARLLMHAMGIGANLQREGLRHDGRSSQGSHRREGGDLSSAVLRCRARFGWRARFRESGDSLSSRALVELSSQLSSAPAKSRAAKPVASEKPYAICPNASLTAPIASGASTADAQVKNRITPAPAPCSDFGRQLMPFELIVG